MGTVLRAIVVFAITAGLAGAGAGDTKPAISPPSSQPALLPVTDFLFYNPDTSSLPTTLIVTALEKYGQYVREQRIAELHIAFYRRLRDMEQYLKAAVANGNPPWLASFSTPFLLMEAHRYGYEPIVCGVRDGSIKYRLAFVSLRKSGLTSLAELAGKSIATIEEGNDQLAVYDALAFRNEINMRSYFGKAIMTESPMSSVMAVIYRQADVAMLDKALFDRVTEGSSRLWQQLQTVYMSPWRTTSGVCAHVGAPPEMIRKFKEAMLQGIRERSGGQAVLDSFLLDDFRACSWEDYEEDSADLRRGGFAVPSVEERRAAARDAVAAMANVSSQDFNAGEKRPGCAGEK